MLKMLKKISFVLFCCFLLATSTTVLAQEPAGSLATEIPITGEVEAGDVICSTSKVFSKCSQEYQTSIYGVVVDSAHLEITGEGLENSRLVAKSGIASVKVTSVGGPITNGGLVTSSNIQGLAQSTSKSGYVLGTALEDYTDTNSENIGRIQVLINVHPATTARGAGSNLLQFIRDGLTVPVFEPLESFRYLLAAVLVIVSFALGTVYFGRSSARGIEAIGRNPLAKKAIQLTILLNIILTIVIVGVGLSIAYLILVL